MMEKHSIETTFRKKKFFRTPLNTELICVSKMCGRKNGTKGLFLPSKKSKEVTDIFSIKKPIFDKVQSCSPRKWCKTSSRLFWIYKLSKVDTCQKKRQFLAFFYDHTSDKRTRIRKILRQNSSKSGKLPPRTLMADMKQLEWWNYEVESADIAELVQFLNSLAYDRSNATNRINDSSIEK